MIKYIVYMYSQKLLNLEIRNAIYNFILKNPGIHFRKIARKNKIPLTTLGYHIRLLKKYEFVNEKNENGYTRYYAIKDLKDQDKKILSLFRQDAPRTIILLLCLYPKLSQVELIRLVNRWKNHPSKRRRPPVVKGRWKQSSAGRLQPFQMMARTPHEHDINRRRQRADGL